MNKFSLLLIIMIALSVFALSVNAETTGCISKTDSLIQETRSNERTGFISKTEIPIISGGIVSGGGAIVINPITSSG
jgi:hypothetical protein